MARNCEAFEQLLQHIEVRWLSKGNCLKQVPITIYTILESNQYNNLIFLKIHTCVWWATHYESLLKGANDYKRFGTTGIEHSFLIRLCTVAGASL